MGWLDKTVKKATDPNNYKVDSKSGEHVLKNIPATAAAAHAGEYVYDELIDKPQKAAHEQRQEANNRTEEAYQEFDGLDLPVWDNTAFGEAALAEQGGTEFDQISEDPRLKDSQMRSLETLERIGSEGGLLAADKALLAKTQRDAASQDRGRREAILQNAAARGMGGTGNALLAQLDSSQAATERSNQAGLDIAGMAQDRALNAILQAGSLGGDIRGQEYGMSADRARAQDAINQFNTGQKNSMGQFNTNIRNDQIRYNNDMKQQGFENQWGVAKDKANIRQGQAVTAQNRANQHSATAANNINTGIDLGVKGAQAVAGGGGYGFTTPKDPKDGRRY